MKAFSIKLRQNWMLIFLTITSVFIMTLSIRGLPGNPTSQEFSQSQWKENGPFELSPERGRFALTYSLVENKSFQFSEEIAQFASPDVATSRGKYVSIFAPLLSIIVIPGYLIGTYFGASQVGSFAVISFIALLNMVLIRGISIRLGAHKTSATIASMIFLFATPSFAYGVNLYQHHVSTFLLLVCLYTFARTKKALGLVVVFFICALAISLDYPNFFLFFPIGLYAISKIFTSENNNNILTFKISVFKLLSPLVMLLPILMFLTFNYYSYGNPYQLSGTLENAQFNQSQGDIASVIEERAVEKSEENKSAVGFFKTRNMLNGFYIHFISPDRGVIFYAPIMLFGLIGLYYSLKKDTQLIPLLTSIIGVNILLYSMWGDPWGGWAFGSRYLIPTYALGSIFIAITLERWKGKKILLSFFFLVACYCIAINTLGAITTSAIPPKIQVLELEKISGTIQRYTYQRNWEMINSGNSKSFAFQSIFNQYVTALEYYFILTGILISTLAVILFPHCLQKSNSK